MELAEIDALGARGGFVRDRFAGAPAAREARAAVEQLVLRPARVGREPRDLEQVRGDTMAWLTAGEQPQIWARFEALRREVREQAWLGLMRFDLQVARYGSGAAYERHRDAFPGGSSRRLTAIWYLNDAWQPPHGGLLRLHLDGEVLDVEPRLDRLVVFLSEKVEHEVLPALVERWAITAWFHGP